MAGSAVRCGPGESVSRIGRRPSPEVLFDLLRLQAVGDTPEPESTQAGSPGWPWPEGSPEDCAAHIFATGGYAREFSRSSRLTYLALPNPGKVGQPKLPLNRPARLRVPSVRWFWVITGKLLTTMQNTVKTTLRRERVPGSAGRVL